MSKSAAASSQKLPPQLSTKSAWSKGPPPSASSSPRTATTPTASSPRAASPALPNATPPATISHSRRPSTLGQGVNIKDGVSVAQRAASAVKQASSVTFGSIDDVSAPVSSSPAAVPTLKTQGGNVKTFGSIVASTPPNGKAAVTPSKPSTPTATTPTTTIPSTSTPATKPAEKAKPSKAELLKMFQSSSTPSPPATTPAPAAVASTETPTPSSAKPAAATPAASGSTSSGLSHTYTPFVPSASFRGTPTPVPSTAQQQPPAASSPIVANGSANTPRSPAYPRQMSNGASPRPSPGQLAPGTPQANNAALPSPSPRMAPMHVPPPNMPPAMAPGMPGMPPQGMPMQAWPGYYYPPPYPGMPPEQYMPYGQYPYGMPPPHLPPPGGQPVAMSPMSPRGAPLPPAPGTPSAATSALPPPGQAPPTSSAARMNHSAPAFVPGGGARKSLIIRDADGRPLDVNAFKNSAAAPASPIVTTPIRDPKRASIRIESEADKLAREKRERDEKEAKERVEREQKEKVEAEKKAQEEAERKAKEDGERKVKEEAERKVKEEEARKAKEEADRKAAAEAEQKAKEEAERKAEEERQAKEEADRKAKEEAEREAREAEEREAARLKAEEEARNKAEEEEAARKKAEEEQRLRKETEAKAAADAQAAADVQAATNAKASTDATPVDDKEEGEIDESPAPLPEAAEKPKLGITTENLRKRPGPLDLSNTQKGIVPGLPSALATARIIEDINQISYPEGIMSPKLELNMNAKEGKFRYDRDFLLQFMSVCKEKPDSLPPLDAIGLEPADQGHAMYRGGSGRRTSNAMPPLSRQASVGLGIGGFGKSGFNAMGQFGTGNTAKTSDERFRASSGQHTPTSSKFQPASMSRTNSASGRSRGPRGNDPKGRRDKPGSGFAPPPQMLVGPDGQPLGPVKPLEKTADAWMPQAQQRKGKEEDDSPAIVDRKVKALLNKLTMEKFDSISDQIIAWANKSESQRDGRTLIQVIRLVFEKATDEAAWSEMYARLCRKMMEQISPDVQDESIKNPEGKPIAGGQLFRKYLLNRCQEDFERGWASKEAAAAAAKAKEGDDAAVTAANADKAEDDEEIKVFSEEYYASQKAKRQGLGLVKFIGELFKLQMLTERIMHECVKKLLGNVDNPEEEDIESLCKLLTTVGKLLDTQRAGPHMDIYFARMRELSRNPKVNSRMQYMLLELTELRDRKWIPRNLSAAPATIAQIREDAAKESLRDQNQRTISMSRGGSRRGGDRNAEGPDGWAVAGGNAPPRAPPKAGDLSQFGKISKPTTGQPMTFGPSSVFNKKGGDNKRESASLSRASSINAFSLLSQNPETAAEVAAPSSGKNSRAPSRKPSVDLGSGGAPESMARRKLNLLPRSKPVDDASQPTTPEGVAFPSVEGEGEDEDGKDSMSEAEATKKIDEDLKEFFAIRNIDEGEDYFEKLPTAHHPRLIEKVISRAIESKESDAQLVADLFARAVEKELCTPDAFEQGFLPIAEMLDDIAIDAPKAFNLMALMLRGSGLAEDEERRGKIAEKSIDAEKLLALLS